jgi:glycosyltransferase involved in cell wall biosynthesis
MRPEVRMIADGDRRSLSFQSGQRSRAHTRPTVLVYRGDLLPLSETFIKQQMLALSRWRGVLTGQRQLNELSLEGLPIEVLRPTDRSIFERARWKVSEATGSLPRAVVEQLKRSKPALVHAHFGVEASTASRIALALDVPLLVTLHGYDVNIAREWWETGHAGRSMRRYPARLLELSRRSNVVFLAVSEAIRERAIGYGIPENKISVHYIGVDCARFRPTGRPIAQRERRVLFVGRLVEKKGCDYLIRAFARVQQAVPESSLVIVGDGALKDSLTKEAKELGVRAEFRGACVAEQVQQEFALARVFCLPSVTAANGDAEGFGLVILEAQASGVPVVTSARGGAAEGLADGRTGYAVPERDVDALSERLIHLLTSDEVAIAFSEAGRRFAVDNFDLSRCTDALESIYDRVSSRHGMAFSPAQGWRGQIRSVH